MSELYHFSYISKLNPEYDASVVVDIVRDSRKNNLRDNLTGILVYDGEQFFQYIEGAKEKVLALLARLQKDFRHIEMSLLFKGVHVSERYYNDWQLAFSYADEKDYIQSFKSLDLLGVIDKIKNVDKDLDFEP